MRTKLRSKVTLLFLTCAVLLAIPAIVLADNIGNNLDGSIDADVETTSVNTGSTKNVGYLVQPLGGDGKPGCNLTGSTTLVVSVSSSNTSVATVSPSQLTFNSCGATPSVTVTGVSPGTANITLTQVSNNTGGTFDLNTATFSVTVSNPTPPADTTAPTIGYTLTPGIPDGNNGWYKSNVTLTWTVTDPESAVTKTGCVDQNITSDQAATTYSCSATSAGGSAGPESVTIKRDGSAPNAPTATTNPADPIDNSGGFFKDTVTVSYGGSTDVGPSGIAGYTADQAFNTTGTHNYSGKATDNAGNESAATTGQVKVDAGGPSVQISGCPTSPVVLNSTQNITVSASDDDNGSGLVSDPSGSVSLDTSSVGSKTKTITVEDKVGHTKSETCNYSIKYDFGGFLQPINYTAHQVLDSNVSTFKAGSTIPVKFQLKDANGNVVQSASAPQWTVPQKGNATAQAVDEGVFTDQATNGTLYKWDGTQYHYNWSTKGVAGSFYYKIGVKLDDGQTYYVYISLR
jgi:hypothetical protein